MTEPEKNLVLTLSKCIFNGGTSFLHFGEIGLYRTRYLGHHEYTGTFSKS